MTPQEIENEVKARVEFKMNELLTAISNRAKAHWGYALSEMSQKHTHYWEAFNQMQGMFKKELSMAPPCDEMFLANKRSKKDRAIEKIMERFRLRGTKGYHEAEKFLSQVIEDAQNT